MRVRDRCMGWVRGWLGEEVCGVGLSRKSSYVGASGSIRDEWWLVSGDGVEK